MWDWTQEAPGRGRIHLGSPVISQRGNCVSVSEVDSVGLNTNFQALNQEEPNSRIHSKLVSRILVGKDCM